MGSGVIPKQLFTPTQVRVGTFFGGPLASTYFLVSNFQALGKEKEARATKIIGGAGVAILVLLMGLFPMNVSSYVLALFAVIYAGHIANKYQLSKEAIQASGNFAARPSGQVFWATFIFALVTNGLMVAVLWIGIAHGVVNIPKLNL